MNNLTFAIIKPDAIRGGPPGKILDRVYRRLSFRNRALTIITGTGIKEALDAN